MPINTFSDTNLSTTLERLRAAFLRDGAPSLKQRRDDLRRLKAEIVRRRSEITAALNTDFGQRSEREAAIMELIPLVQGINYLSRHLRGWMKPERRSVAPWFLYGSASVIRQPLGVVGIMAPWNYPVSLALLPLATAIAAGNRAMIKPSELTPATSAVLQALIEAVFPADQVTVVTGGPEVGGAFSVLPFDHLLFTGSTSVGRKVALAAAGNLTPVTLELGGKSPVVIEPGFSAERAAEHIAFGKLANAGQTCIAPDYVFVHEDDRDAFVSAYRNAVGALYPAGFHGPDYTAVLNAHHHERLSGLVREAGEKGARIVRLDEETQETGNGPCVMAPVLLLDVTPDMAVMQEEIFGPVLPVMTYRKVEDVVAYINAHPRPLALYYFGDRGASRDMVLSRTTSGGVTINGTLMHYAQDDLPFGGVGASGIGAYHGREGFVALTHARGVFRQGRLNGSVLLRPPFGKLSDMITGFMLR